MVVGRKAKLPSLLIFSSVGSERARVSQDHVKIG